MKHPFLFISLISFFFICSCSSPPEVIEKKSAFEPDEITPAMTDVAPPDYTKDWQSIANLGGTTKYPTYVTKILWKRLNWRMTLSSEWIDDIVEDMQRRYRWDKKLSDWVGEHGNPEWPR